MKRFLAVLFTVLITSLFFFPFEIKAIPGANSKMILAGVGLILFVLNIVRRNIQIVDSALLELSIFALVVSIIGFISVIYNDTRDYTYATYILSMFVWLASAYLVVCLMKTIHGYVSVRLVCNYLILLCVLQSFLALAIDFFAPIKAFANQLMVVTPAMEGRLYGIDASLDIAGSRFSAVLIMIVHNCVSEKYSNNTLSYLSYIISFFIIVLIGNMIARTTTVGAALSLVYMIIAVLFRWKTIDKRFLWYFAIVTAILVIVTTLVAYANPQFYSRLRFGFEGFFSLVEKGRWEVSSNEILKNMVVFPEELKTWIIGDGYFNNPYYEDPFYIGIKQGGYYMSTDIGYCRFIFYFGLLGLFAFILFFIHCAKICVSRMNSDKWLFLALLLLNFLIWFKVSTDIFLVFAILLCVCFVSKKSDENGVEEQQI